MGFYAVMNIQLYHSKVHFYTIVSMVLLRDFQKYVFLFVKRDCKVYGARKTV